ncbi:hypothetical protein [Nostoc sp.]|uniref:hypothetical protein n=1 Tax=Nostoc sp. TaxID=1180 RepID=UPI002FF79DF7
MSYFVAFVESFFQNMSIPKYQHLRDTIEEKLNLDEFLLNKTSVYQTTSLYKEAWNHFILEEDGANTAKDKFIQLTEQFPNDWSLD